MAIPLISAYFLYFALSTPSSYFCDPQSRNASCTSKDSNPVCAVYSGDECYSASGFCQKTLENACTVCMDPSIISYVPGECKKSSTPQLCTDYDRNIQCSVEESSVCSYAFSVRFGRQKVYNQLWKNGCEACNPNHVTFHIPGECPNSDDFGICQKKSKISPDCSNETPSCAYYTGENCSTKICRKTLESSCDICNDSSVLFYINGTCENLQPSILYERVKLSNTQNRSDESKGSFQKKESSVKQDNVSAYQEIHKQDDDTWKEHPIPKIETLLLPDGSEKIVRVEPSCVVPDQPDIPMLEEVVQPDGSVIFEPVERSIEKEKPNEESIELIDARLLSNEKKD